MYSYIQIVTLERLKFGRECLTKFFIFYALNAVLLHN